MRRVTIELSIEELSKIEKNPMLDKIKSLQIIQFLKESPEELAVICRVEFSDPTARLEDFIDSDILELQVLDREKDGTCTYFIRTRPASQPETSFDPLASGGFLSLPFEFADGKTTMTYLGDMKQIKDFLEGIDKLGVRYKLVSVTDAKFSQNSPLSRLTEKQRRVLVTAYRLGYYDVPRRISSEQLAEKLKIRSSALIAHRRKAERRLIAELVDG